MPSMHELICNSCRYCFVLLFLLSLPVLCYTDFILNLWLVEVPDLTTSFIKILLLYCIVSIVSKPMETAIRATGSIKKYVITYSSIEFLNIPISWFLLTLGYTPISTALIILALGICGVICRVYFCIIHTQISLKYILNEIGIRFFLMFLFGVMTYYIFTELLVVNDSPIRFVLNISLLTVTNLIYIGIVCIKKNERLLVLKKFRSIIYS